MSLIIICIVHETDSTESKIQPQSVEYDANIHDRFALCKLKQTFHITMDNIVDAAYEFPVDYNSAFCDLVIRTPREDIRGCVKEKSEAKKMYNDAKQEGKQAFLTEESESDRDIYRLSMCNLLIGDDIIVEYTYITELQYSDGSNIFYIPNFISPRYGGNMIPSSNNTVNASVKINNPVSQLKSSMSDTNLSFDHESALIEYNSCKPLETDIEITYNSTYQSKAVKFNINNYEMALVQFVPKIEKVKSVKEIVFILDCSGSMEGDRIDNSRKAICHCLDKMRNTDYSFNIISYGDKHQLYSTILLPATNDNIQNAINYCKKIEADMGGTETYNALQACLQMSVTAILITDGDTSGNDRMHQLCKKFDCLSILGIGSGINRANIKDMSKNGSGIAVFSQNETNILQNMNLIFDTVNIASIKQPKFSWLSNVLCTHRPILSAQPNIVYALTTDINEQMNEFRVDGIDESLALEPYNGFIDAKYLGCLIAKRIIQECEINEEFTKETLINLAVNFNIITKYTSMVAVSASKVTEAKNNQETKYLVMSNRQYASVMEILSIDFCSYSNACVINNCNMFNSSIGTAFSTNVPVLDQIAMERMQSVISDCCLVFDSCVDADASEMDDEYEINNTNVIDKRLGITDNTSLVNADIADVLCAFEWYNNQLSEITIDILQHFDTTIGLFNMDARKIFNGLLDTQLTNEITLTIFVLMCLKRLADKDIFVKYYKLALSNESVAKIMNKINHF